jgi:hypothetical protein
MAEVPRCFITADPQCPLNLTSRHTFLGLTEKHGSRKPLEQRQMRIVENCAGCYGELVIARFAVEELLLGFQFDHGQLTAQTGRAFGPAETHKQLAALLFGRKHGVYIN